MNISANANYGNIKESYLFSEIAKRVRSYSAAHPDVRLIRMGIGDVTLPIPPVVVEAMTAAVAEMGVKETFRGYPPESGYEFLKQAIARYYTSLGVDMPLGSIFVSDGAKSDIGNLVDILGDNEILIPDPVYPVYVDSNLMSGRHIHYLEGNQDNGFLPMPDLSDASPYVIYLCSPNNPTGAVYDRTQLQIWVDHALKTGSLIIFDAAYGAFIEDDLPRSIYEIPGARDCAIEVCSFSKFAGFTGLRCGWTIVPEGLSASGSDLNKMWNRRQSTKFNGVSYPVQRAAEAALSDEGLKQCARNIACYKSNAAILADVLRRKGVFFTGGTNSPYIWFRCPDSMGSWELFDKLLEEVQIVGTPGEGFGSSGEGYMRLTAFGSPEDTAEAAKRLEQLL